MEGIQTARADVCEPESLVKAVKAFGAVDVCIANAGMSGFSPLVEQDLNTFDQIMRTNVTGVVATVQAVAPGMMERRAGQLVVIGSVSGAMVTPYAGAYCASKAAVTALCDALRMELRPFGIGVLEVVTGAVQSNFGANAMAKSRLPTNSRYGSLQSYVDARAQGSQAAGSMPAADYAKIVADAALDGGVRMRVVAGGHALKYHLIGRLFPRAAWATKISKTLGLHTLGSGGSGSAGAFLWLSLAAACLVVAAAVWAGLP